MIDKLQTKWTRILFIIGGSLLYAAGMNWFITPLDLYSGGGVGFAQLLNLLIGKVVDLKGVNLYGILYMLINIPLLLVAYKSVGRTFFMKTLLGSAAISFFITMIPTATTPIVDDYLTSVLIGGIITGFGVGMILLAGGCGGGVDIIGVWAAKKYKGASVGKISLAVNAVLFLILLLLFQVEIVIYSLIYIVFFTIILDKVHYQNINVRLMIFTKEPGIDSKITKKTGRGVTKWKGAGAYTEEATNILVSCINKYEVSEFMELIHEIDPKAFIIVDEGIYVSGNFEKRI